MWPNTVGAGRSLDKLIWPIKVQKFNENHETRWCTVCMAYGSYDTIPYGTIHYYHIRAIRTIHHIASRDEEVNLFLFASFQEISQSLSQHIVTKKGDRVVAPLAVFSTIK